MKRRVVEFAWWALDTAVAWGVAWLLALLVAWPTDAGWMDAFRWTLPGVLLGFWRAAQIRSVKLAAEAKQARAYLTSLLAENVALKAAIKVSQAVPGGLRRTR